MNPVTETILPAFLYEFDLENAYNTPHNLAQALVNVSNKITSVASLMNQSVAVLRQDGLTTKQRKNLKSEIQTYKKDLKFLEDLAFTITTSFNKISG
jgi:hypothetical protein